MKLRRSDIRSAIVLSSVLVLSACSSNDPVTPVGSQEGDMVSAPGASGERDDRMPIVSFRHAVLDGFDMDSVNLYINADEWTVKSIELRHEKEKQAYGEPLSNQEPGESIKTGWLKCTSLGRFLQFTTDANTYQDIYKSHATIVLSTDRGEQRIHLDHTSGMAGGSEFSYIGVNPQCVHMPAAGGERVITFRNFPIFNQITIDGVKKQLPSAQFENKRNDGTYMPYKYEWLTLVRQGDELKVTFDENKTGKSRSFIISISDGPTFDAINGIQTAD